MLPYKPSHLEETVSDERQKADWIYRSGQVDMYNKIIKTLRGDNE